MSRCGVKAAASERAARSMSRSPVTSDARAKPAGARPPHACQTAWDRAHGQHGAERPGRAVSPDLHRGHALAELLENALRRGGRAVAAT